MLSIHACKLILLYTAESAGIASCLPSILMIQLPLDMYANRSFKTHKLNTRRCIAQPNTR